MVVGLIFDKVGLLRCCLLGLPFRAPGSGVQERTS